ncbi:uncharacterized protein [Aegilops tauschii subsp. strangulata]|uniref:uncharacterized protein isoform X2 n=1 Tax=Aegilops tauschii subsp. strangulata TaxID=200361 RepID=UPI003CC864B8
MAPVELISAQFVSMSTQTALIDQAQGMPSAPVPSYSDTAVGASMAGAEEEIQAERAISIVVGQLRVLVLLVDLSCCVGHCSVACICSTLSKKLNLEG